MATENYGEIGPLGAAIIDALRSPEYTPKIQDQMAIEWGPYQSAWDAIKAHAESAHGTLEIGSGMCSVCYDLIDAKDEAFPGRSVADLVASSVVATRLAEYPTELSALCPQCRLVELMAHEATMWALDCWTEDELEMWGRPILQVVASNYHGGVVQMLRDGLWSERDIAAALLAISNGHDGQISHGN
jgi:hypothetical protein